MLKNTGKIIVLLNFMALCVQVSAILPSKFGLLPTQDAKSQLLGELLVDGERLDKEYRTDNNLCHCAQREHHFEPAPEKEILYLTYFNQYEFDATTPCYQQIIPSHVPRLRAKLSPCAVCNTYNRDDVDGDCGYRLSSHFAPTGALFPEDSFVADESREPLFITLCIKLGRLILRR